MNYIQSMLLCCFTYLSLTSSSANAQTLSSNGFNAPRISSITFNDTGTLSNGGSSGEPFIDTVRGVCGTGSAATPEPFYDTIASFTIVNPGTSTLLLSSFTFSMKKTSGSFRSKQLGFNGVLEIAPGETVTVQGLAFQANGSAKLYPRTRNEIGEPGFRTVRFTLRGRQGNRSVAFSGSVGASFAAYDRCSS